MSAVVLPAASAAFTSTQVIFSNSTRSACARGAARADPAANIREAVPPAINISKECETEPMRMSFSFPQKHKLVAVFNGEPTILQIHYYHAYSTICARFCYSSRERVGSSCPVPIIIVVPQPCGSSRAERLCDPSELRVRRLTAHRLG